MASDLRFLLAELAACECSELALLVATLLLDAHAILALLGAHTALCKPYLHMLHIQPVAGYQQLRVALLDIT